MRACLPPWKLTSPPILGGVFPRGLAPRRTPDRLPRMRPSSRAAAGNAGQLPPAPLRQGPLRLGTGAAMPGRETPDKRPSTSDEAATTAPVLPAETKACACPACTARMATAMDEFFLVRMAVAALSSMPTTSGASISSTWPRPWLASSGRTACA